MNQLLSEDLWPTIKRLSRKGSRKRAAIAYVTSDEAVAFGTGDLLVTDASDAAIKSGQTSAGILERAVKRGAEVFSLPNLHAKMLLLDGTAVIGSANLSASSESGLVEAAWVSDNPITVGMATSTILDMSETAERIDAAFIKRIKSLPVTPRRWNGKALTKRMLGKRRRARRNWLVGLHEIQECADEADAVQKGFVAAREFLSDNSSDVGYIRFTGSSRFRRDAARGDTVIQIWRSARRKSPSLVFRHAPIIYRQDEENCTRFFIEEASDAEKTALNWRRFQKLAGRIGISGPLRPNMARAIGEEHAQALFSLWKDA
jgi:hypothetical protein